jgi:plasmid replication initiation protein
MQDNFIENLKFFQWVMYEKFKQTKEASIDVIIMLAVGHVFGAYTPNQLSELLGIAKSRLYEELSGWSIYQWRKRLIHCNVKN